MKKITLIAGACALTCGFALMSYAAVPFRKGLNDIRRAAGKNALKVKAKSPEPVVMLEEDFSKFSDGSEENPGEEIKNPDRYYISEDLTAQPGWTGMGLHPCGGSVLVMPYMYDAGYGDGPELTDGYISTPPMPLGGTVTVTFRAKAHKPGTDLWVAVCDDYYGPADSESFYPDEEWREYSFTTSEASLTDNSYFQFRPYEGGEAYIDDIRITLVRDRIATPYALPATNVSPTEFKANWEETGAPSYLLSVYSLVPDENPVTGKLFQNFDGITPDGENKNIPEGWTMTFGGKTVSREEGNFSSAPQSVVFDEVTDMIETPRTEYPLTNLDFWVKPSSMEQEEEFMSLLRVEVYHAETEAWESIAQVPNSWMEENGGIYGYTTDEMGSDVVQVRLSMIQKGVVDFYLDDLTLSYASNGTRVDVLKDAEFDASGVTVKDIDPAADTYYIVKAKDGDVVSPASSSIWVDGIAGLKVNALPATDVTNTSFTANWEPLGHATSYKVDAYATTSADEDMAGVVVLEESFDNIDEGTVETPGTDWNSPYDFSARGWASTGWCATQPAWIEGMAGTTGTSWWGTAGLVYSPLLDLSCDGGEGFDVDLTVLTTVNDLSHLGMQEPEGVFALVLDNPASTQALASGLLDTPVAGINSGKVHVDTKAVGDLKKVYVALMNKSGSPFFVDHVKITQNLRKGEVLSRPLASVTAEGTSLEFKGLDPVSDHSYAVTASTTRDYRNYISEPSDRQEVSTKAMGVENVIPEGFSVNCTEGALEISASAGTAWSVYTVTGIRVASGSGNSTVSLGNGIYLVKTGSGTLKLSVR